MAAKSSIDGRNGDELEGPPWLDTLLCAASPPSQGFLARCDAAGAEGLMVLKLRRADRQLSKGPAWKSAPEYARLLAARARVPLAALTQWARLPDDLGLRAGFGQGWARLADALRWSEATAVVRLRLAFAELTGESWEVYARRDLRGAGEAREVCKALAAAAEGWDPGLRRQLEACEAEFHGVSRGGHA